VPNPRLKGDETRFQRRIRILTPFTVEAQRERLSLFADAGINTAVLTLLCPPQHLAGAIDAFAPR
jgi:hypothetical protein